MYVYIYIYKLNIYLKFLAYICVLYYLSKLQRGMALASSAYFLYTFFIKMFLTKYIPYQLTKFQYQT